MSDPAKRAPISEAALEFGARIAREMFAKRKGHGGAPVSERHVSEVEVAAMFALGYDVGAKSVRGDMLAALRDAYKLIEALMPGVRHNLSEVEVAAMVALGYDVGAKSVPGDMLAALRDAYKLIEALMPGVRHIALQDYRALNETPIAIAAAIARAEGRA